MERKKVLFISQEITPYVPTTDLSTLGRALPQGVQEKGFEVRTFMPKYGCINERRNQLHEVIRLSGLNVIIDDTDHPLIIKVASLQSARTQVYFIDNDDYFHYTTEKVLETESSPADNDERAMFFVKGTIETVKKLRCEPSIIHCVGWISALAPLYLKRLYSDDPTFSGAKVIYAIRSEGFEGSLDPRFKEKLKMCDIPEEDLKSLGESVSVNDLHKLAIDFSDGLILSSDNIAPEVLEYAKTSGKPILGYSENGQEGFFDSYANFYTELLK